MNLLLTSVGRRGYLVDWFKQALDSSGHVHAASSDVLSPGLLVADIPVISPPVASDEYSDFVIEHCRRHEISAVIPLIDVDVVALAESAERLRAVGTVALVPSPAVAAAALDKWSAQSMLARAGCDAPRTYLDRESALAAVETGALPGPIIVKPRYGMGGVGVVRAGSGAGLSVAIEAANLAAATVHRRRGQVEVEDSALVFQEALEGELFSIDVVNDLAGTFSAVLARRRLVSLSGETTVAETVRIPELDALGERLSQEMRHPGPTDVDVIRASDGRWVVIDINPRFGGCYPFSHLAGADLPSAIVAWLAGREVDARWLQQEQGVISHKVFAFQRTPTTSGLRASG